MYRASPRDGVAWITGASSGIGRAVALELASRGFAVAATARRAGELATLCAEAKAAGGRIDAFPGDVTDRAGLAALAARIEEEFGPVALAMLNAGANFPDLPRDCFGDGFRKTMALNFDGVLNGLAPLVPRMQARGRGQIAVMGSVAGYGGLPTAAAYCASKAALIAMCESLVGQYARMGLTLQIISPGFVRTPLTDRAQVPKPFMIGAQEAARRICEGFYRGGFEIAFPRRLVWTAKAVNLLPYGLYLRLFDRVTPRGR